MANNLKLRKVKKDIKQDIDKRFNKANKSTRKEINTKVNLKYQQLLKGIILTGCLAIVVVIAINLIIGKYVEKKVNKQTIDFFEKQKKEFETHITELKLRLDSISNTYQSSLYEMINTEIKSDSFKIYTNDIINNRFDKIVPAILNKQIHETTRRIETESKRILDSLSKNLTQYQTVVDNTTNE